MRKTLLALIAACSLGCGWVVHPIDTSSHGFDHRSKAPRVLVQLGQAQQICLPEKSETVEVDIFIILRNLPATAVGVLIDGHLEVPNLYGTSVTVHLQKVALGQHEVKVTVAGMDPVTLGWTVWLCPPKDHGELYKPDGSGLKDYCNCPGKEELCTTP